MYLYDDDDDNYYCVGMSSLFRLLSSFKRTASTTIEYTGSRSVPSLYNPIPQLMSVSDALDPIQYLSHYKSHTIFLAGPFEEVLGRYDVLSIGGSTVLWLGLLKRWIHMPCTDLIEESGTWKFTFPSFPKR